MDKNKVTFTVAGSDITILTNDSQEYIRSVAAGVDDKINAYTKNGARITVTQAAILAAMEYADENRRKENILDNIKVQLKTYLDDAAKIKEERDKYKHEYEKLLKKTKE